MKRRYITAQIVYDDEETWDETLTEVLEIMDMMNSVKRHLKIIEIEDGVDIDG